MSGPSVYSTPGKEAYYDYDGGHRRNVLWNYKLSPALTFSQNYVENAYTYHNRYLSSKKTKELKDYSLNSNRFNLQLDDNDWKGHIAYGIQKNNMIKLPRVKKLTNGRKLYPAGVKVKLWMLICRRNLN